MVFRVRLGLRAISDAEQIYRHVTEKAPGRGPRWFRRTFDSISTLQYLPSRCAVLLPFAQQGRSIRRLLIGTGRSRYVAYFEIRENEVWVLHIRHGSRQTPTIEELAE